MAAGKETRFAKLVEESGRPEVVTLWADPKKDRAFTELIRKGRILTIIQKPTGTRKDFGLIGFHPQPFAAYLVFPKPLRDHGDAIVIGIKYDQLEKTEGRIAGDPASIKIPKPAPPPKPVKPAKPVKPPPVKKAFEVAIRRSALMEMKITVTAFNAKEAKTQALAEASSREFIVPAEEVESRVLSVSQGKDGGV